MTKIIIGEKECPSMQEVLDTLEWFDNLFDERYTDVWEKIPIDNDGISFANETGKIKAIIWYEDND